MARAPFKNARVLTAEELQIRLGEFYKAVEEYNDGYYFESHETLEDLWMVTPLPDRDFFQAVIQLAAALVHLVRGEYPGIVKLLDAAAAKLGPFVPDRFSVDVAALLADVTRAREELASLGPERFVEWDESRRPRITMASGRSSPPLVR